MAAVECAFSVGNAVVSMASIVVGGFIGYFSARRISNKNERAVAVAKFRASFSPALAKLFRSKCVGEHDLREFFDAIFLDHAAAFEEFRPFVSDSLSYQEAWNEYQKTIYANDALGGAELRWDSGMMFNEHGDNPLNFLDVIGQQINNILSYA